MLHVLPYMCLQVLLYTFYMLYLTGFQRLQTEIGTIYPLAVLCQDLGIFTLLAAVL